MPRRPSWAGSQIFFAVCHALPLFFTTLMFGTCSKRFPFLGAPDGSFFRPKSGLLHLLTENGPVARSSFSSFAFSFFPLKQASLLLRFHFHVCFCDSTVIGPFFFFPPKSSSFFFFGWFSCE